MNQEIIPHVFASLHTLERYVEQVKNLASCGEEFCQEAQRLLPEYEKVAKQMRRIANKLQFHVAANDVDSVVRALRIFYGLNHMLRPELLGTLVRLTKGDAPRKTEPLIETEIH